jgi:hypothetical protein
VVLELQSVFVLLDISSARAADKKNARTLPCLTCPGFLMRPYVFDGDLAALKSALYRQESGRRDDFPPKLCPTVRLSFSRQQSGERVAVVFGSF